MNDQPTKKEVTLEAIKLIVDESVTKSVAKSVVHLATKEEITVLHEDIGDIQIKLNSHIIETKNRLDGLTLSLDDLPTRAEMNAGLKNVEQKLELQIDDLAVSVHNEFERIHIKFADMDSHLVEFKQGLEFKMTGIQNQLDTIYTSYPNRTEFTSFDKRLKKVEKFAFA